MKQAQLRSYIEASKNLPSPDKLCCDEFQGKGTCKAMKTERSMTKGIKMTMGILVLICMGMLFAPSVRAAGGSGKDSSGKVQLSRTSLVLIKGDTCRLQLTNAGKKTVWRSLDESVATVTSRGKVKAVKSGSCVIRVRSAGKTLRCRVTVCSDKKEYKYRMLWRSIKTAGNRGKVLVAGASPMERWRNVASVFAPHKVLNMGISGSTPKQWLKWYKKLIVAYEPSVVVLSPGARNEYRRNHSLKKTTEHTCELLRQLHRALPDVPIYYTAIYNNYRDQAIWPLMKRCNRKVKKLCRNLKNVYYIDLDEVLHDGDDPKPGVITTDDVHLSKYGYTLWSEAIVTAVEKDL